MPHTRLKINHIDNAVIDTEEYRRYYAPQAKEKLLPELGSATLSESGLVGWMWDLCSVSWERIRWPGLYSCKILGRIYHKTSATLLMSSVTNPILRSKLSVFKQPCCLWRISINLIHNIAILPD